MIYGHHMEYGVMFGSLDDFRDEQFFNEHKTGTIQTEDAVYAYDLFAALDGDGNDPVIFSPHHHSAAEVLKRLRAEAQIYTEPEEDCRIVAMSTCSGDTMNARLIVFGTIREAERG